MANTLKILGQAAPIATTETDLYTVPISTTASCSSITICNRGNSTATFRVSVSVGSGATASKDYLYYDVQLAAYDTFICTIGISLGAADKVRVYASTASLSFNLFGMEVA